MKTFCLFFSFLMLTGFDRRSLTEGTSCLSSEEMKLYELILEYRKSKDLASIPLSAGLTLVAQTHARDLAENYTFELNNKCNPHSWSSKGNWSGCCYTNDHQKAKCMWAKPKEIAGYAGNGFEIAYYSSLGANAQEGLDGWKISPGHNPLLINSGNWANVKWKAIGIGIYKEFGLVWFGEVYDSRIPELCK